MLAVDLNLIADHRDRLLIHADIDLLGIHEGIFRWIDGLFSFGSGGRSSHLSEKEEKLA